ncbi:MAG: O-antigen ligase family protein [Anaerolineae bacterium]
MRRYPQQMTEFAIYLNLLCAPMWLKLPNAPAPFTAQYVLGFWIVIPLLGTVISWAISGFRGWHKLVDTRWQQVWWFSWGLLLVWGYLSQYWAYGLGDYPGIAPSNVLQIALVLILLAVIQATAPPLSRVKGILMISMLIHGTIGGLQVVQQGDIGLGLLGEFALDPMRSGVSVLETDGTRWLRPYGLLPHPNILGGVIVLGLFASATWLLADGARYRAGVVIFALGFWFLLLSFSRGAWLGFAVGILWVLPRALRIPHFWRKIIAPAIAVLLVGGVFVAMFQPLLLSRAGVDSPNTELRSIADRLVYIEVAENAIREYPLHGVGIGNFAWYASNYIFYNTRYDLNGNNVHNIYLLVWSELGIIGLILFGGVMLGAIGALMRAPNTPEQLALMGAFVAWAVIGLVDHYMWTLIMTQVLWLSLPAFSMGDTSANMHPSR